MQLPNALFRVARELPASFARIAAEVALVPDDCYVGWPDRGAYSHGWLVLPFVLAAPPPGFVPQCEHNRALCPDTAAVLDRFPEIITAGVSRLLPGCHVYPHVDKVAPFVYRCHLGLSVKGRAGLRAGADQLLSADGSMCVFDHRLQHEAANLSDHNRDVLLVDFVATPDEREALERWRRGRGL